MDKRLVVGGDWGEVPEKSSLINELGKFLEAGVINGGSDIRRVTDLTANCVIWMPNISNSIPKYYPKKPRGGILICSKVLRFEGKTLDEAYSDAVSRIFDMHGNAVIALDKRGDKIKFTLIDALGNLWGSTDSVGLLAKAINRFLEWNTKIVRVPSHRLHDSLDGLCFVNRLVAQKVENAKGQRYFGNCSTRCSYMFPSMRNEEHIFISKRNVSKEFITPADFVRCSLFADGVTYTGDSKPSIDAPVQLKVYSELPWVKFMIHGHAYIRGARFTSKYHACGDLNEANEILELRKENAINLRNHGFLIMAADTCELENIVRNSIFEHRELCERLEK
jgi:hypothetical protein